MILYLLLAYKLGYFGLSTHILSMMIGGVDYQEINGTDTDDKRYVPFDINKFGHTFNGKVYYYAYSGRIYFGFFDKETYKRIRPTLTNTTIPKKERIKVFLKNNHDPVCHVGEFKERSIHIKCFMTLTKGGTLLVFPEDGENTHFVLTSINFFIRNDQQIMQAILIVVVYTTCCSLIVFIPHYIYNFFKKFAQPEEELLENVLFSKVETSDDS